MIKKIIRTFTISVPVGTKKQLVRELVKDVTGTEFFNDREIDVLVFEDKEVVFEKEIITSGEFPTEQELLLKYPEDSICKATIDKTSYA